MAATAIYSYAWLVPLALWGFLTWRSSKVMSSVSYSFLEIVCVYGYSLSIYIPAVVSEIIPGAVNYYFSVFTFYCIYTVLRHGLTVYYYQVLWIIPSEGVRWFSIVAALCLSGSVLVMTFWPTIREDRPRVAVAIVMTIVALHVLLAVGCKVII